MSSCYPTAATKQNIASDWKRQSGDSWRQMLKWNSCSKHSYQTISIRLMYYLAYPPQPWACCSSCPMPNSKFEQWQYSTCATCVTCVTNATMWQFLVLVSQYLCDLCDFCDGVTILSTCATCVTVLVRLVWLPLWVALSWPADAVGLIRIHSLSPFRVAPQHLLDNSTSANHNGDSVKLNRAFNG